MSNTPIHFLIDNNILRRLAPPETINPQLDRLALLIKQGYVALLLPQALKEEWTKHKEILKTNIDNKLKPDEKFVRQATAIKDPTAAWTEEQFQEYRNLLYSRIEILDSLIENNAIRIERANDMENQILSFRRFKKAPFHKPDSKDHINDAEIIYYSLNYLQNQNIGEIYFVSENSEEFGMKRNDGYEIHADIEQYAKSIQVNYYINLTPVYKLFDLLGFPDSGQTSNDDSRRIHNVIPIDKTKPILNQIHQYLQIRLSQLSYIPKRILFEHYPFIIGDNFDYYHKPFTLITDNLDVYKLLTSVKIEDGTITYLTQEGSLNAEDEAIIKDIFKLLFENLIYKIGFKIEKEIPLQYKSNAPYLSTYLSKYSNLQFADLLRTLSSTTIASGEADVRAKIKIAYCHYKLGNYKDAAILLNSLRKETQANRDLIHYLICFNLKTLSDFIPLAYIRSNDTKPLIQELNGINLNRIKKDCTNSENRVLIEYIHNKKFVNEDFPDLFDSMNEIRRLFNAQSSGISTATEKLIEIYFSTEEFLSANSIMYDAYSEFKSMATLFVEGSLTSYGCGKMLAGKLSHFDDTFLTHFIHNGNGDDIIRLVNRNDLSNIQYIRDQNALPICDVFSNLLDQYEIISTEFGNIIETQIPYFWQNYEKLIYNSLTVFSVCNFDIETIGVISEKIVHFISRQTHFRLFYIKKGIRLFLWRNRDKISLAIFEKFFLAAIAKGQLHDESIFDILHEVSKKREFYITLPAPDLSVIKQHFIDEIKPSNLVHNWNIFGDIYLVLSDEEQKKELQEYAARSLAASFNIEKYCLSCLLDILLPTDEYTHLYFEEINKIIKKGQGPRIYGSPSFYQDSRIDHFLNFCFKYKITLPSFIKDQLSNLGPYYSWLTDMDGFDYSKFDPEWLSVHFSLYYKRKFRSSTALKSHLLNLIKGQETKDLEKYFVYIYCYDD